MNSIDDVASVEKVRERTPLTSKDDIVGVPLTILGFRKTADKEGKAFIVIGAVREDTDDEINFSGGTVLEQQMKLCEEQEAFPVRAVLTKGEKSAKGQRPWIFRSPPQ